MRHILPLYQFRSQGLEECTIVEDRLYLRKNEDLREYSMGLFSSQDVRHINETQWALEYMGTSQDECMKLVNRWLMVFRYLFNGQGPFVKYRVCKENDYACGRLVEPFQFHNPENKSRKILFDRSHLDMVARDLPRLHEMEDSSNRTKNAIFYSRKAMSGEYWGDAFLWLIAAQEALLSKDTEGKATLTFATRTASLIKDELSISIDELKELYNIRSEMVHGKHVADKNSVENLHRLERMEKVLYSTFRIFISKQLYSEFGEKTSRDTFLSTLNSV